MKMKMLEIISSKYHSLAAFLKSCSFTDIALADRKLLNLTEFFTWLDLLYLNLKIQKLSYNNRERSLCLTEIAQGSRGVTFCFYSLGLF